MRYEVTQVETRPQSMVVKIGSSSLARDELAIERLCAQIESLIQSGWRVTLVSSGAIAFGWRRLGLPARPSLLADLQACAAAGQSQLIHAYQIALGTRTAAQVLLTRADLEREESHRNACAALDRLHLLGALPIINENDTVAVDEIRFGDNDVLAALVCPMVQASLLVLLTDVDGLLDFEGNRASKVEDLEEAATWIQAGSSSKDGSGGMVSKLNAVRVARSAGTVTVIAPAARPNVLVDVAAGADIGTLFNI